MPTFGTYLTEARKKSGLSQKDLATRILKDEGGGISPQYLNDLERDRRNPPNDQILRQIATILDLSLDYLHFLAGRIPEDLQGFQEPEKVEDAFKAFRKAIKGK